MMLELRTEAREIDRALQPPRSTDQFDLLCPLVDWVEKGEAPDRVIARARGPGNPVGVNRDVPASWSKDRSRPLCPYPEVARLKAGAIDLETADSFACEGPETRP